MYRSCFKPLGDFVVAAVLVVVLFPVGMVVMLALVFEKKGNVFFVQERIGYQEKPFYIIKFRTMASKKNEQGRRVAGCSPDYQNRVFSQKILAGRTASTAQCAER